MGCGKDSARRAIASALGLCVLVGCTEFGTVDQQAVDYNVAADTTNNKQILINLLRAGHDRPAEWTSFRIVQGQRTLSGQGAFAATAGPRGTSPAFLLTPTVTDTGQSQSQIDVLDAREFYQNYLHEIDPSFVANYFHDEIDALYYYLFFSKVEIYVDQDKVVADNNPGNVFYRDNKPNAIRCGGGDYARYDVRPDYGCFQKLVEAFFDANLVPTHFKKKTKIGPPLTAGNAIQQFRGITAAATGADKDARLFIEEADSDPDHTKLRAEDKNKYYQVYKNEEKDEYCLRGNGVSPSTSDKKHWTDLEKAASALRCGAADEERKPWEEQLKEWRKEEEGESEKKDGPGEARVRDASLTVLDTRECDGNLLLKQSLLGQYCAFVEDVVEVVGALQAFERNQNPPAKPRDRQQLTHERLISIKIVTRSTADLVKYLGRVAAWSYQRQQFLLVPEYPAGDSNEDELNGTECCGEASAWRSAHQAETKKAAYKCYRLVVVEEGAADAFVAAPYAGKTYRVPALETKAGLTPAVFEVLHQLIAYDKVAKDLPAANIISVTPIP